jgi:hypothetical protein
MRIWSDCIPCILKMSVDVARLALKDEEGETRYGPGAENQLPQGRRLARDIA